MSNDHFFDDQESHDSGRELAKEVICRVFLWIADGGTLDDRGFRATVAIHAIRPDLFDGATLEEIGSRAGRQRQAVWKLREDFRSLVGL